MSAAIPCPVCAGPISTHVVRPLFTCHHCLWALRANLGNAFRRAVVVGVIGAVTALGLALLLPFTTSAVIGAWLQGGAGIGLVIGTVVYRAALVLTPLRPQRKQTRPSE